MITQFQVQAKWIIFGCSITAKYDLAVMYSHSHGIPHKYFLLSRHGGNKVMNASSNVKLPKPPL